MLGTIVNTIAILVGGTIGLLLKGGLKKRYRDMVMKALPLSVIFVGASSAIGGMLEEGAEPILFIVSLVVGSLIGEWIDIEGRLQTLGDGIQSRIGNGESNISKGFVAASLLFCVGTMAILGSLESGIEGVHTTLFVKSVLDGTTSIIFASTMGIGVLFSAVSVFIYQGILTMCASFLQPYLTADMIREISIVGGIMIFALGLNMLEITKIKVGNMLPAILIPVIYFLPPVQALLNGVISW